jgi:hypothetical protein
LNNQEIENKVFSEVEDLLDDFYVDIGFIFDKLTVRRCTKAGTPLSRFSIRLTR